MLVDRRLEWTMNGWVCYCFRCMGLHAVNLSQVKTTRTVLKSYGTFDVAKTISIFKSVP